MAAVRGDLARAQAAQARGTAAFRQGDYALARRHFGAARRGFARVLGEDAPETLEAGSDFGAACAAAGDHAAARATHEAVLAARRRSLGASHPSVGSSLHNLGTALRAQGEIAAAEVAHLEGLRIWQNALGATHPVLAKSLGALGVLARARGDAAAALDYAQRSLALRRANLPADDPQLAVAFDDLAGAYALAGDEAAASEAWQSALAVLRRRFGAQTARAAPVLNNLGVMRRSLGDLDAAQDWFAAAVTADSGLAVARHNLAACLARRGEAAEAKRQRDLALAQQSVFVQNAIRVERARVLILSVSDDGNVPLEHILPERDFTRIWWFPGEGDAGPLPPFDCVFNAVGDPDMVGATSSALPAFLRDCKRRVLNPAEIVARTRRDLLPATLAGIEAMVVPPICRLEADDDAAIMRARAGGAGVVAPFLLRPAGSHGGAGLRRLEGWDIVDGVDLSAASAWYLSSFVDFRSADGFYRKYRMVFVDRRPYPYHLAISTDWLVHYFSADMQAHAWKLAEEAAFLADPPGALGVPAYDALVQAGVRLDLDFCGIDFTVLPDGRLLVFEANATMLIHPESEGGTLAFKNVAVGQIIDAVARLVESKQFFFEKKNQKTFEF